MSEPPPNSLTEQIKAVIVIDRLVASKAIRKHEELAPLLSNAPQSVAGLARLMSVATKHDDFELQGKNGHMSHTSFVTSLVQVTNWGCSAYVFASAQFDEVKSTAERIPDTVKDMLDSVQDQGYFKETAETIATNAKMCAAIADKVVAEFLKVSELMSAIFEEFVKVKHNKETSQQVNITTALKAGMTQLNDVKDKWDAIGKFFKGIATILVVDMAADSEELRAVAQVVNPTANTTVTKRFAGKAIKICMTSIRVYLLADSYMTVSKNHLENPIRQLSMLIADAKNNCEKFVLLAEACEKADGPVLQIINESKELVMPKFLEAVSLLKGEDVKVSESGEVKEKAKKAENP